MIIPVDQRCAESVYSNLGVMAEIDKSSVGLSSLNRLTRELEEKKDQVGQRQHRMAVASTAKSKLEGLRQKTCHMKAYNQSVSVLPREFLRSADE